MELRPDGSVLIDTPLSMSRLSHEVAAADALETATLVRLTLGGNPTAFEEIIRRYETRVMTLAVRLIGRRDEARDVTQEVFLRAFKYLHRLNLEKPFEPWLMRIAVNVCRNALRRRQCWSETFVEDDRDFVDQSQDQFTDLSHRQERVMLHKALAGLPERERLALLLRDVEGLPTSQVAVLLGSSEATVRSQVSRGRLRLKAEIDRMLGDKT